jgi:hypothetical protein
MELHDFSRLETSPGDKQKKICARCDTFAENGVSCLVICFSQMADMSETRLVSKWCLCSHASKKWKAMSIMIEISASCSLLLVLCRNAYRSVT